MTVLFRLITIFRVFARYRLDQLLPNQPRSWRARLLLLPFKIFPTPKLNAGERLRRSCEDLGPVFVKFGQLLSTRPDLVPADIALELNHLQDNVAPFDKHLFKALVEKALEAPVETLFASFEEDPLASASIAQVHGAVLKSGQPVVIKIIRPGIEKTIAEDMQLLALVARLVEKHTQDGRRLRPVEIVRDYRNTIFDELDLQREASNASQLRRNFAASTSLYIPEIYWDYCRKNILVMERIYGIPVTDIAALEAQQTNMKKLAERGVEIFFTQVFEHNFFHADMHPGNIFVSREHPQLPQYIAVDMAIVGSLTREDQYYLARNLLAMFRRDYLQVAELHIQSGWVPADTHIGELESAIRSVCEPIFEKPLRDISFGHVLLNLFQTARRFNMEVQPQLILLQKTLLNIEGMGRQLYPELNLWITAHPYLERWIEKRFHPMTLWKELQRYAPEWLEKFPQVPHLVFDSLQQTRELGGVIPELQRLREQLDENQRIQQRQSRRNIIALLAFSGAAILAWPGLHGTLAPWVGNLSWSELPGSVYLLLGIGAGALLLRK